MSEVFVKGKKGKKKKSDNKEPMINEKIPFQQWPKKAIKISTQAFNINYDKLSISLHEIQRAKQKSRRKAIQWMLSQS